MTVPDSSPQQITKCRNSVKFNLKEKQYNGLQIHLKKNKIINTNSAL